MHLKLLVVTVDQLSQQQQKKKSATCFQSAAGEQESGAGDKAANDNGRDRARDKVIATEGWVGVWRERMEKDR
eukprot:SAG31_NODE_5012_length_2802_cov_1.688494_2_plen_73_part_00